MTALRGSEAVNLEFGPPRGGTMTRESFEQLPKPPRRWVWELRDGRLELVHMPVGAWHWKIILMIIAYWTRAGYETSGEQYVCDSGFAKGGSGRNNVVADAVASASNDEYVRVVDVAFATLTHPTPSNRCHW